MSVLEEIVAGARQDLADRERAVPLAAVKAQAARQDPAVDPMPGFRAAGVSIIAEVKRASPSKGQLASIDDPAGLAAEYESGGASAVSVITERRRFGGSVADLRDVRSRIRIPVLRKDFITSSYQLWETRAAGADMVLLIVAALDQPALVSLVERAVSIGLTPLVEVHDEAEVERAIDADARLVGVNARNLHTLDVDRTTFARLAPRIPDDTVRVAESGVRGPRDVIEYAGAGADVVLVGESLVTDPDPRSTVAEMVAAGAHPALKTRH
jgi:indole-3-glycerol phosphate synthase